MNTPLIAGIEWSLFIYYMLWAWLGQVAMFLIQIKKYFERIQNQGGFAPQFWWKDNKKRIIITFGIAIILSPIPVLFAIRTPDGLTEFACVGAGAIIDRIVESFTNKKK